MNDSLQALLVLQHRLGRPPTLDELYRYTGVAPSGRPDPGPSSHSDQPGPSMLLPPQADNGPLTTMLRHRELLAYCPELQGVRDRLMELLLYGQLPGSSHGMTPQAPGSPMPSHKTGGLGMGTLP